MPTREELLTKLRNAHNAGDTHAAKRFAEMIRTQEVEQSKATGLGAPLQAADDMMRIGADAVTRGYLDKWLGPEERAKTEMARQRAGWAGTAMDTVMTYATLPAIKGGGMVLNALGYGAEGAAQGAASAHGHDQDPVSGGLAGGIMGLGGGAVGVAPDALRASAPYAGRALQYYARSGAGPLFGAYSGGLPGALLGAGSSVGAELLGRGARNILSRTPSMPAAAQSAIAKSAITQKDKLEDYW